MSLEGEWRFVKYQIFEAFFGLRKEGIPQVNNIPYVGGHYTLIKPSYALLA